MSCVLRLDRRSLLTSIAGGGQDPPKPAPVHGIPIQVRRYTQRGFPEPFADICRVQRFPSRIGRAPASSPAGISEGESPWRRSTMARGEFCFLHIISERY